MPTPTTERERACARRRRRRRRHRRHSSTVHRRRRAPFDPPRLQLQFSLSFGWPAFSQPRLGWQLAVGCLLVALQLLFRAVKWALRHSHSVLRMPSAEPGPWERRAVEAFAVCSWRLFGGAADRCRPPLEETMGVWGKAWNFVVLKKGA